MEVLLDLLLPPSGVATVLLSIVSILVAQWCVRRRNFVSRVTVLPGPHLWSVYPWMGDLGPLIPTIGSIPGQPQAIRNVEWFLQLGETFCADGLFHVWLFGPYLVPFAEPVVVVTQQSMIRQLLTDPSITRKLIKEPRVYRLTAPLIGGSFLSLPDGPSWKHQRKMAAQGFHQIFLEHAQQVVVDTCTKHIFSAWDKRAETDQPLEMVEWCMRLVTEILGRVAFSCELGCFEAFKQGEESLYEIFLYLYEGIVVRTRTPGMLRWFQFSLNRRFRQCSRKLDTVIQKIVTDRLSQLASHPSQTQDDLLSYLLPSDTSDLRSETRKQLFANCRMFLFAGHDTTASALSYCFWELAMHLKSQKQLQQEIDILFADRKVPLYKNILQMKYLDAVVKETLRLHSPIGLARATTEDITLDHSTGKSYLIPKGCGIFVLPLVSHRNVETYPDRPNDFVPERFLHDKLDPHWIPFSIGPRNCVGQPLAMAELKSILVHCLHRYTILPIIGATKPIPFMTIATKPHAVMVTLRRRRSSRAKGETFSGA